MVWLNEPTSGRTWTVLVAVFFCFLDWIELGLAGYHFDIPIVDLSLEVRRLGGTNRWHDDDAE